MSEEKTIEQLQAELDLITKQNLERELAEAKKVKDEAEVLVKEKEATDYREQVRKEVMDEMAAKEPTKIVANKPEQEIENLTKAESELNEFRKDYVEINKLTGLKYEDMVTKLKMKGFRK